MAKKRSKQKYPNLVKEVNLIRRQELIDFDYLDKLDEKDMIFLNKFMGEYMSSSFPKQEVNRDGKTYKRVDPNNIHKKEHHKSVYDANNARNRDIYATKSCIGGITFFDEIALDDLRDKDLNSDLNDFEDALAEKDLLLKDKQLYKIKILEYIQDLRDSAKKKKDFEEIEAEIQYLKDNGYDWVFED